MHVSRFPYTDVVEKCYFEGIIDKFRRHTMQILSQAPSMNGMRGHFFISKQYFEKKINH